MREATSWHLNNINTLFSSSFRASNNKLFVNLIQLTLVFLLYVEWVTLAQMTAKSDGKIAFILNTFNPIRNFTKKTISFSLTNFFVAVQVIRAFHLSANPAFFIFIFS